MTAAMQLKGEPGSPYTCKMLAFMRYRRMPYRLLNGTAAERAGMPKPAVELLPTFYLPNAAGALEAVTDSTPLIRRFEREQPGRSVLPPNPVMRFINSLLEDYADEWLTKAMFHYRWNFAEAADKAGSLLPLMFTGVCLPEETLAEYKVLFSQRQISRLAVVGSNPITAPLIEAAYARTLDLLEAHLRQHPFLMGARPGAADFAFYGQLKQLAHFDPTSMAVTLARAPRVFAWVYVMEDLSGMDPNDDDWFMPDTLPSSLADILTEAGRGYVPLMLANARALMAGVKQVETRIDGQPWVQQAVAYQGKCMRWLREEFATLSPADQAVAAAILQRTACAPLIFEAL